MKDIKNKSLVLLTLFAVLTSVMLIGVVFAQEPTDAEPNVLDFTFEDFGKIIPATVVSALVTSVLGYMKQTDPAINFELDKFTATLIIGFAVGIIMCLAGVDYVTAYEYIAQGGLTIYIYWIAKIIAKKAGWIKPGPAPTPAAATPTT